MFRPDIRVSTDTPELREFQEDEASFARRPETVRRGCAGRQRRAASRPTSTNLGLEFLRTRVLRAVGLAANGARENGRG